MNELMALHTGQSLEQIERDTERDRFLPPLKRWNTVWSIRF
ncbi:ATP-dependent Clp protease proteolytic subunit [Escherichia coli]|uniref:ATP-dependent Clp protease proteolytic subunit n=1 Tax=Escherichia coli TaxID=562 RepID=A0A376P334_ECOLX|nr:ATP-dependent Clp protease proteolytic subunit [Escherichia coli]